MSFDVLASEWARVLGVDRKQFNMFFEKMMDGFAYHKIIMDKAGKPVDYIFLEVNHAFERLTGLKKEAIIGKKVTEVLRGIENDPADWIGVYGRVALTCEPVQFENYAKPLDKWFRVSAYCPEKGYFVALFEDITERKKMEKELFNLAKFPSENPDAVFCIDTNGLVLYANPVSQRLPKTIKLETGQHASSSWRQHVNEALSANRALDFEETSDGRFFLFRLVPFPSEGYVNIYGTEITERKKAEEALQESEEKFRAIAETSPIQISVSRASDGTILFTNPAYDETFGYNKSELIGLKAPNLYVNPKDRQKVVDALQKQGFVKDSEVRVKRKDGTPFWIAASVASIRFGGEKALLGASIDISDRKKAEEELRKINEELEERVRKRTQDVISERQRLYNVLETLPAYVVLLDKDYRVPFANKVFRERFGESHGRRCYDFLFNRNSPCDNCETYKILKTNAPHRWEWTGPDGRDYDIYDFPFVEADGSTLILEMGIDITERKKAEAKVHTASLYSRSLIEASPDPLVTINAEGKITDVNKATEMATGCGREALIGSDFCDYFTDPEEARRGYQKVFKDGFVKDYPLAIRNKSGRVTEVLYNAAVYRNEAGEIQGVFAAARDITELKKAEELAEESVKKLKDAERLAAIGATAGMVGHDIRNPLQAIIGDLYLAKNELTSLPKSQEKDSIQESLEAVEKSVDYINKIVSDLQDYAKPITPVPQETDVEDTVKELIKKNGLPKNIRISSRLNQDSKTITTDPDLLKRILGNLVSNAVQAMPDGGKLTVRSRRKNDEVVITVQDTGVGIPENVKPKLFMPLFTTKSKGQGFGLAVVKRMTEALGGTVTFESQQGKGTKFTVHLPQRKKPIG